MAVNTLNSARQLDVAYLGFLNTILISRNKIEFANESMVTYAAIEALTKTPDPTLRAYIFNARLTVQPTAEKVTVQMDLTTDDLYDKLSSLILKLENPCASEIRNLTSGYNGKYFYVYFITSKGILRGTTTDGIKFSPITTLVTISNEFALTNNHAYLNLNLSIVDVEEILSNVIEKLVPNIKTIAGFVNVDLSLTTPTPTATELYVKVMKTADNTIGAGGLIAADFTVESGTITTVEYQGEGVYKITGTGFANTKIISLDATDTISQNYEATGTATITGIV